MFDVGFSELLVVGIVALIVIGPERLPKVARTLGHLLGRAQRYVNEVKSDIHREMHLDELKHLQHEVQDSMRTLEQDFRSEIRHVEETVEQAVRTTEETPPATPPESVGHNEVTIEAPQYHYPHAEAEPPEAPVKRAPEKSATDPQ